MEKARKLRLVRSAEARGQFEHLLVRHLNTLYSAALRLTGSKEKAEDLVQESSLKAFRKFGQLEDTTKIRGWLLQILFNTFRDHYRKKKSRSGIVDIELSEEVVASASLKEYDQEQSFGELLEDEVQEALVQLPEEFRAVIVLYELQDCSYQEIAEILECSMGTVASRLFRGRQLLREYLEDYARGRGFLQ